MKLVVRNIQNNDAYFYLGENKFKNIRTEKEGIVDDETARKVFKINLDASEMINEFPIIEKLINVLDLVFDNNKKQ